MLLFPLREPNRNEDQRRPEGIREMIMIQNREQLLQLEVKNVKAE